MLFAARRLDAVVIHAPEMYGPYGTFHMLTRGRSVLIENSDAPTVPNGRLGARLLESAQRRTTLFLPWSTCVNDSIASACPDAVKRMHIVHPGLPLDRWPARDAPSPLVGRRFRLLFVGGDAIRKGLDILVDAFESPLATTCELDIATQSTGLPDWLAAKLAGLESARVHLDCQPGSPEMQSLFRHADVLVLPTRYDLSPWVVIEAMATGVPVVASDVGGMADMVIDGVTGILIESNDVQTLVAAIEHVRDLPDDRRVAMAARGREHVEQHFDATANTARMLELIKATIDQARDEGAESRDGVVASPQPHDPSVDAEVRSCSSAEQSERSHE